MNPAMRGGLFLLLLGIVLAGGCARFFPRAMVVIKAQPQCGYAPLTVEFDATDSNDNTEIVRWQWCFGSGDVDTTPTATRTFGPGEHEVKLIVWDTAGTRSEGRTKILVRPEINGVWMGSFLLDPDDDGSAGFELNLALGNDGRTLTGTLEYGLYDDQVVNMPIVEGWATYDQVYIHAEGNSAPPVRFHRVLLEGAPGEMLAGEATTHEGERHAWVARRR